jgi:hypothetical protein
VSVYHSAISAVAAGVLKAVKRALEIDEDGLEIGTKIRDKMAFGYDAPLKKNERGFDCSAKKKRNDQALDDASIEKGLFTWGCAVKWLRCSGERGSPDKKGEENSFKYFLS